jgi:LPPG:FO 2-phospho-L-lactate transferase
VEDVEFAGVAVAPPTPEVLSVIAEARAIVIGPSNPVISIGPILALPGMRDALKASRASVVAVSPIVNGAVLKPATVPLMQWAGEPLNAVGIASYYGEVLDGLVADDSAGAVPVLQTDVLMGDADGRRRVAEQALEFALALR